MRLEAARTPVTAEAFAASVVRNWWRLLATRPPPGAVLTMTAQSIFETGWWKQMRCFNVGNAKSLQRGGDWYFVTCTEYLDDKRAHELLAAALPRTDAAGLNVALGDLVNVAKKGDPPVWKRHVRFYPDHAASCFRGFATLDEGVKDHLGLLIDRFANAWPALLEDDVVGSSRAIRAARYYTDTEEHYTGELVKLRRQIDGLTVDTSPPPVDTSPALEAAQASSLQQASWDAMREDAKDA